MLTKYKEWKQIDILTNEAIEYMADLEGMSTEEYVLFQLNERIDIKDDFKKIVQESEDRMFMDRDKWQDS